MSVAFPSGAGAWIGVTNAHGDSATTQDVYRASCQGALEMYLVRDYFWENRPIYRLVENELYKIKPELLPGRSNTTSLLYEYLKYLTDLGNVPSPKWVKR